MMNMEAENALIDIFGENGGVIAPPSYFTQVPDAFSRRTNLTMNEKMLFIYLWGYAANKGHAFPSQGRMLTELGTTKPTLNKLLKSLEEKGGIFIVNQFKNKAQISNLYFLAEIDMKTGEFGSDYLGMQKQLYPDKKRILK